MNRYGVMARWQATKKNEYWGTPLEVHLRFCGKGGFLSDTSLYWYEKNRERHGIGEYFYEHECYETVQDAEKAIAERSEMYREEEQRGYWKITSKIIEVSENGEWRLCS